MTFIISGNNNTRSTHQSIPLAFKKILSVRFGGSCNIDKQHVTEYYWSSEVITGLVPRLVQGSIHQYYI